MVRTSVSEKKVFLRIFFFTFRNSPEKLLLVSSHSRYISTLVFQVSLIKLTRIVWEAVVSLHLKYNIFNDKQPHIFVLSGIFILKPIKGEIAKVLQILNNLYIPLETSV